MKIADVFGWQLYASHDGKPEYGGGWREFSTYQASLHHGDARYFYAKGTHRTTAVRRVLWKALGHYASKALEAIESRFDE